MKRGDIWIAIILTASIVWFAASFLWNSGEPTGVAYADIMVEGKHYDTVLLTEEEQLIEIKTSHGLNLLKVHDHGIEMIEADCPDQICVGFGHIHKLNEKIVCLPNRIFVEIIGADNEEGIDAFVS